MGKYWKALVLGGLLLASIAAALLATTAASARSVRRPALASVPSVRLVGALPLLPQLRNGHVYATAATTSSDSSLAGYGLLGPTSTPPTKVSGTFVIPTFYCTGAESFAMSIQLVGGSGGGASGFLDVRCAGAGTTPTLTGAACASAGGRCGPQIQVASGQSISITAILNSKGASARLVDVTTRKVSSDRGPGGTAFSGFFIDFSSSSMIPTFSKVAFSSAKANGLPLGRMSPTKLIMKESGTTLVRPGPLSGTGTAFSTVYRASAACPKIRPHRAGNPSGQGGFGFDGVYRLGDKGSVVAPSTGPAPSRKHPGPFAPLGGVYAAILNCSPWVQPGSYVSSWVMLQQFGNGNDHIQIGWEEFAHGKRETLVELQDSSDKKENSSKHFENCDDRSTLHELRCFRSRLAPAPVGTFTYYTIEYHPENKTFRLYTQQLGHPRVLVASVSHVEFVPNQASIFGETHSNYDQMPGTSSYPEIFGDAHVYNADGHGWENFFGQLAYNGTNLSQAGTTFSGSSGWYALVPRTPGGSPHKKTGQDIKIWDTGA